MRICGILVVGVLVGISGCGTLYNTEALQGNTPLGTPDAYRIYGGVRHDLEVVAGKSRETVTGFRPWYETVLTYPCVLGIYAVDLPLSFVADTLTLPLTLKEGANRPEWWRDASAQVPPPQAASEGDTDTPAPQGLPQP